MKVKACIGILLLVSSSGCGGGKGGADNPVVPPPPANIGQPTVVAASAPIAPLRSGAGAVATGASAAQAVKSLSGSAGEAETGGPQLAATAGKIGSSNGADPQSGGDQTQNKSPQAKLPEFPQSSDSNKKSGGGAGGIAGGGGGGGLGLSDSKTNEIGSKSALGSGPHRAEVASVAGGGYAGGGGGGARSGGGEEAPGSLGAGSQEDQNFNVGDSGNSGADPLGSEDPGDYFNRIDVEENLFKRVEKRYFKKATAWVLQDTREIVPRKNKLREAK